MEKSNEEVLPEMKLDGTRNILAAASLMLQAYPSSIDNKDKLFKDVEAGLISNNVVSAAEALVDKDPDLLLSSGFDAALLVRLMKQLAVINQPLVSADVNSVGLHNPTEHELSPAQEQAIFSKAYELLTLSSARIIKQATLEYIEENEGEFPVINDESSDSGPR